MAVKEQRTAEEQKAAEEQRATEEQKAAEEHMREEHMKREQITAQDKEQITAQDSRCQNESEAGIRQRHEAGQGQEAEIRREQESPSGKTGWKIKLLTCLLYIAVLSTATYAWFTMNNKPKVLNLALTAAAAGDLMIADDLGGGPGEYGEELDLKGAIQKVPMEEVSLNPVTTTDGEKFYEPVYTGTAVSDVKEITDQEELNRNYIYEKTFYLKAGSLKNKNGKKVTGGMPKVYDIMLLGPKQDGEEISGCEIRQADGSSSTVAGDTAANSIRISFLVEGQDIAIYEPNSDKHNSDPEKAIDNVKGTYGTYATLQQGGDGSFAGGEGGNSEKMFTIEEEQDVKVTMRVWMEGTDEDCTNSNEMDEIMGNIQFISSEVKSGTR